MTLHQRRTFLVAFGGVLVASRMYVSTSALLSCYERVFGTKKICIFHDFGILDLRTTEPFRSDSRTFFSNLQTFGLKNLRTHEPSNLRTFGLIGCNRMDIQTYFLDTCSEIIRETDSIQFDYSIMFLVEQRIDMSCSIFSTLHGNCIAIYD